ncbi:MAG: hypothetical protein EHM93_13590 [Bacteroidales bacterium]|nr:MAG: hypothetical protein EHM93_13590 [Bacteroidales bacterium]
MKTISMIGALIVTLALISYSIAVFGERKKRHITKSILSFLTIGIILDITATICMIIGSTNSPFTIHGLLGYSALTLMLIDTIVIWKFYKSHGFKFEVPMGLHKYTLIAYSWWVIAYITGSLLVMIK